MSLSKALSRVFFAIFCLSIPMFLLFHKVYVDSNTPTYTHDMIIRQPLYSIFLALFNWAGQYRFSVAMWIQGSLTFFSLLYARSWLKSNLQLTDASILPIFFVTLITISFHYQMVSVDDPEGITFPLFIFAFFQLVDCFSAVNFYKITVVSGLVSLLILTRTQFYFFYGVFIVLLLWFVWKKFPAKYILYSMMIFVLSAIITNLADRTYHYFENGSFINEPFSGILTVIQPFYLADPNAFQYFQNSQEKNLVKVMQHNIASKQLNHDVMTYSPNSIQYYEYLNNEYAKNYLDIQDMLNKAITHTSFYKIYDVNNASLIKMDKLTLDISQILFIHNIKKNTMLYSYKIVDAMGGIPCFIFFALMLLFSIIKIFQNRTMNLVPGELFVFLMLLISFLNAMVVAVAEPNCARYFCYTQFLLYCFGAYVVRTISNSHYNKLESIDRN